MTKRRVIGTRQTAAATGAVTTVDKMMAYIKQLVTLGIARDVNSVWRTCLKADGALLTGNDPLFTISGGPVRCKIVGIVTTLIVGSTNGDLMMTVTIPSATTKINTAPVAVNDDAAGTIYYSVGATAVFTPVTAGFVLCDPVTVEETELLLPPGTVIFRSSAAQDGVIAWYMTYQKLSSLSSVVAAA